MQALKKGDKFKINIGGEELSGQVRVNIPSKDFQAEVENFGGALLRVQVDPCQSGPGENLMVILASFGAEPARIERIRKTWSDCFAKLTGT